MQIKVRPIRLARPDLFKLILMIMAVTVSHNVPSIYPTSNSGTGMAKILAKVMAMSIIVGSGKGRKIKAEIVAIKIPNKSRIIKHLVSYHSTIS